MSWCFWTGHACSAWPGQCQPGLGSWVPSLILGGGKVRAGDPPPATRASPCLSLSDSTC